MFALVALAQANAFEALLAQSPRRPSRSGRSQRKAGSLFAAIASPIRRAMAWADSDPLLPLVPLRPSTY
jgi:hypothetical protein